MKFFTSDFCNYERAIEREWLLTNGLGGYAASTLIGANTRRYHSLLTISLDPPIDRMMIVSKLDETVIFKDMEMSLSSQKVNGHVICGFSHLLSVDVGDEITWSFIARDAIITKTVRLVKNQNRVIVKYKVKNQGEEFTLRVTPLLNSRYFHFVSRKEDLMASNIRADENSLSLDLNNMKDITIEYPGCRFIPLNDTYYYSMQYDREMQRGLDYIEDHYIPGFIEFVSPREQGSGFEIEIYAGNKEQEAKHPIRPETGSVRERLERACEDFIVYRKNTGSYSIIAGYPWFNDWGRDAMISVPGILLETERYDTAKDVLRTFAGFEKAGIIPNMLPDGNSEPLYNTVDASLWFIHALNEYYKKTNDGSFVKDEMMDTAKSIINNYRAGTMYNIKMDIDALISAGDENMQLSWMDAKVGDFVVTPRHGKAVEINALWYNALCIMFELTGDISYKNLALKVYQSFNEKFVDVGERMLYDCIDSGFEKKISKDLRPNAVFAISLPYSVLDKGYWRGVFERIFIELYTPYGLRSLSYKSRDYRGYYGGDQFERDTAYHQGTVWSWLIGAFIEAYIKIYNDKETAFELIEPLLSHLNDSVVGSIAEIFEGSFPHKPRGAFAQAWSVGELLRAYNMVKGDL